MTGNAAVTQIWKARPDAKMVCMTGSSEDVRLKDITVVTKPFSLKELGHSIFHLLRAE